MPFDARPAAPWPAARPLVKWTGGKTGELDAIRRALPRGGVPGRYVEPFVGGGALLFAMPPDIPAEANDRSGDLVSLYRLQQSMDAGFLDMVAAVEAAWVALDGVATAGVPDRRLAASAGRAAAPLAGALGQGFPAEVSGMALKAVARKRAFLAGLRAKGQDTGEEGALLSAALKGGLYTALRAAYNRAAPGAARSALFWFLRDFCYGGMFRVNARGEMNVPYGGISYNARSMRGRLDQLAAPETRARLATTRFHQGDFEGFLRFVRPGEGDFVFLDPPYDSPFSTYDGNAFTRDDHRRLAAAVAGTGARWMLVISETEFVRGCYCGLPGARTSSFDKLYLGNIKGRVDGRAVHLVVTNYDWEA